MQAKHFLLIVGGLFLLRVGFVMGQISAIADQVEERQPFWVEASPN